MTQTEVNAEKILSQVQPTPQRPTSHSEAEKIALISGNIKAILEVLGLDLANDSLRESPARIAKMYVQELFTGLQESNFPKITTIQNTMAYQQMVLVQKIRVLSVCEHHFQPIDGFATVAYIPNQRIIGLSKINRIVQFFSRRPQVQERLTKQIADCLKAVLQTENVAVHITAKHYCVIARGIQDTSSLTTTSDLRGDFSAKSQIRSEFLDGVYKPQDSGL